MTSEKKLIRALNRAGLYETEPVKMTASSDGTPRAGIMVKHDYSGLYPTPDALTKCAQAQEIAEKLGLASEPRGHKTATLIYWYKKEEKTA